MLQFEGLLNHVVTDVAAEGRTRFKPLAETVTVDIRHRAFAVARLDQRKIVTVAESARLLSLIARIGYHGGLRIDNHVVVCFSRGVLSSGLALRAGAHLVTPHLLAYVFIHHYLLLLASLKFNIGTLLLCIFNEHVSC